MRTLGANLSQQTLLSPRALILLFLLSALAVAFAPPLADFAQAGQMERGAECLKGDSKVSKRIAKKVVAHAIKKWDIADLVDEQATKNAKQEVYEFLKWKLGSPSTICGQYVTAGQKHFNKAYGDEAAAALLGTQLPGDASAEMKLPEKFSEQLKAQIDAQGDNAAKKIEEDYGIPPEVSKIIIDKVTSQAKTQIDRIGFNMPKKWDVDNRLVKGLIAAKRNG